MDHKNDFNQWAYELMDIIISKMDRAYEMGRLDGRKEVYDKAEAVMRLKEDEESG